MHNGTSTHDGTTALSPLATLFFCASRLSFTVASALFLQRLLTILRPALGTTTSNSLHSLTIPEVTGTSSPNSCPQTTTPLFIVLCTTAFPVPCTLSRTDPKVCSDYPQISRAPIPTPAPLHTLFAELKSPPFPPTADRRLVHLWLP